MAKHEIVIHENTGATKESAPYLGTYLTKTQKTLADACAAYAAKAGMPALKMQTLIENDIDALTELEKAGACRIHLDGGYVEIRILGSFASSDSAWVSGANRLIVAFTPNDDVRYALVNETGTIVTDETSTKVRLDNVADDEIRKPSEVLRTGKRCLAQGINLCMGDEGAKAELIDATGLRIECPFVSQENRQNAFFTVPAETEPGDYRFVVYSRGGDAGGQLQSSFRKVKVLAGPTPPPRTKDITVSRVVYDSEAGGTFAIGEGFTALKLVDGQRVMGYQTDELDVQPVEFESDTRVKLIAWYLPEGTDFFLQWQADPSAAEYKLDSHTEKFTVEEG